MDEVRLWVPEEGVGVTDAGVTISTTEVEEDSMAIKFSPVFEETAKWSLNCDGSEHLLKLGTNDHGDWTPTVSGLLLAGVYANVDSFKLKTTKPARLMLWMRREAHDGQPADDTFLNDIWLTREGYVVHDWSTMWEHCEANRTVYWLYKVTGASSCVVDTRYVKYALLT